MTDFSPPTSVNRTVPRVLLLTSHPLEGGDGADKQLALAIADANEATDFTWFGRAPSARPALSHGRRVPVLSRTGSPGVLERAQVFARTPALSRQVDLVHAVFTIGPGFRNLSRVRRAALAGRPVIHTVPGLADPQHVLGTESLGLTVALSESTADRLRAAGFPDVRVIPPVIPLDRWPVAPRSRADVPTVLFAGHYDRGGGYAEAIEAAAAAVQLGAQFRLVLAMRHRPGEKKDALAVQALRLARNAGLRDVRVFGRVEDMPSLVAQADAVLFTATALAGGKADVPITVLEAMATGRPVIVSDLPEFAGLGQAVVRAPVADADATARLLVDLLGSHAAWEQIAASGRALVEKDFAPQRMRDSYQKLYRELLSDGADG